MNLSEKVKRIVVITGASSGIGEAIAKSLILEGYRVALLARRIDKIKLLAKDLGDDAIAIKADVTDRDSIVSAAETIKRHWGDIDVLINNAGVMLTGPFGQAQRNEYRQMIETNLLGAMTVTEVFLEQLKANGGGDLINISSVAGRVSGAGYAGYAATKWGMNGWSESLRLELQPAVRVMVIEPGAVATELTTHITHEESKKTAIESLDWAIPPEDIADVIAFALNRPKRTSLSEILIRPTVQAM